MLGYYVVIWRVGVGLFICAYLFTRQTEYLRVVASLDVDVRLTGQRDDNAY